MAALIRLRIQKLFSKTHANWSSDKEDTSSHTLKEWTACQIHKQEFLEYASKEFCQDHYVKKTKSQENSLGYVPAELLFLFRVNKVYKTEPSKYRI